MLCWTFFECPLLSCEAFSLQIFAFRYPLRYCLFASILAFPLPASVLDRVPLQVHFVLPRSMSGVNKRLYIKAINVYFFLNSSNIVFTISTTSSIVILPSCMASITTCINFFIIILSFSFRYSGI